MAGGTYNSVFKRVEKKYRVNHAQRAALEAAAAGAGAMAPDAYGRSRITSLYLDTPHRAMIARSVEKPLYKEKLRLRAYGEADGAALMAAFGAGLVARERGGAPLPDAEVERRAASGLAAAGALAPAGVAVAGGNFGVPTMFFGIKKKFKGVVYKRRLALTLPAALAFVSGLSYEQACSRWPLADGAAAAAALSPTSRQIARELAAAMDRWLPLVPSMGIACDRVAWEYAGPCAFDDGASGSGIATRDGAFATPFDPELRITFDDELDFFDCHGGRGWQPLIGAGESIMEIKSAGPYPPWLVRELSARAVYPASFTKYGSAYQLCDGAMRPPSVAVG